MKPGHAEDRHDPTISTWLRTAGVTARSVGHLYASSAMGMVSSCIPGFSLPIRQTPHAEADRIFRLATYIMGVLATSGPALHDRANAGDDDRSG
ncbi:MAG TPA: hypothetical protein VNX86_11620 [Rhizomicrobium sp.]|nr:hypothetical protein [Rhizomicrobium sp.]